VTGTVGPALLGAALAALAVLLALPHPSGGVPLLLRPGGAPATVESGAPSEGVAAPPGDLVERHRLLVSLLAAGAPVALVGGVAGVVLAPVAGVVVHRVLAAREPAWQRRRRDRVARTLPDVVDLLAVSLMAGAAPSSALASVAAAVDGPVADELSRAEHSLCLGRDPVLVWLEVSRRPGLAALGRTMCRAVDTGAPVGEALHRLSEDLHAEAEAAAEGHARTVGVRAAVPLGLCLLPAFVLVGVVPLVAGAVGGLLAR
jgi:Flp pilus assembly protein TadB